MDSRKECAGYLADCYKEIFFGPVNKRYRSMTGAEMRKRLARLTEKGLAEVEKANELNDKSGKPRQRCRRKQELTM